MPRDEFGNESGREPYYCPEDLGIWHTKDEKLTEELAETRKALERIEKKLNCKKNEKK